MNLLEKINEEISKIELVIQKHIEHMVDTFVKHGSDYKYKDLDYEILYCKQERLKNYKEFRKMIQENNNEILSSVHV